MDGVMSAARPAGFSGDGWGNEAESTTADTTVVIGGGSASTPTANGAITGSSLF